MKKLGITQRVDVNKEYGERRDCLDQRWSDLAIVLGYYAIPLPNIAANGVSGLLDELDLDAIILSGGNSLASVHGKAIETAPERDSFEFSLIEQALSRSIPLLGVCRGMQILNVHFGGGLEELEGHIAVDHSVFTIPSFQNLVADTTNSYHTWGIGKLNLAKDLIAFAFDNEENIEGFVHASKPVAGIMWHPEREAPFKQQDVSLIRQILS